MMSNIITSLSNLPERIQGKGDRADLYDCILKSSVIALLNDLEFDKVIDHNSRRLYGPECNGIIIENYNEKNYLILRKSSIE